MLLRALALPQCTDTLLPPPRGKDRVSRCPTHPRPAWRRCRGKRTGGKRPGRSLKRRVGSAQTFGEAFPNFAFWPHSAGFWPTVLSSCLIPNRWVRALPPPGSLTPRLIQGPQKAGRGLPLPTRLPGLLRGGQGTALSGALLRPRAGRSRPSPPWCMPLSPRVVSAAATQMPLLPPHRETKSPVVKHVHAGPSGATLNPGLPDLCWAPLGKCRNLSVPSLFSSVERG